MAQNLSLLLDLYELTMAEGYFRYRRDALATFDLFVRELPKNRSYLVSCGLEDVLFYVKNLSFSREDLEYLKKQRLFSSEFLRYLKHFEFKGDIWALPEGEIFFANEPVIRVTAPLIQAQLIETFFLSTINLETMIASKASRVVTSSRGRAVFDFALRRTHGPNAGIKVARSSYIAGFEATSNVLAGKSYGIPVVGTMAHSFVMSFKHEMDSFLAYSNTFPRCTTILVDTYDTKKGIENAIAAGLYLKQKGHRLKGIRLDSGDIVSFSIWARQRLDKAGLKFVKIFASGNLDEFKIHDLLEKGARVDSFGVGTNMGTSIDAPSLDVIYKISEVTDEEGNFLPTMKLSRGKATYPGRKQVFRIKDRKGKYLKDILGLEKENINGTPLLIKVVNRGRILYKAPSLDKIRAYAKKTLRLMPQRLKELHTEFRYPVIVSPSLKKLRTGLTRQLEKRQ